MVVFTFSGWHKTQRSQNSSTGSGRRKTKGLREFKAGRGEHAQASWTQSESPRYTHRQRNGRSHWRQFTQLTEIHLRLADPFTIPLGNTCATICSSVQSQRRPLSVKLTWAGGRLHDVMDGLTVNVSSGRRKKWKRFYTQGSRQ